MLGTSTTVTQTSLSNSLGNWSGLTWLKHPLSKSLFPDWLWLPPHLLPVPQRLLPDINNPICHLHHPSQLELWSGRRRTMACVQIGMIHSQVGSNIEGWRLFWSPPQKIPGCEWHRGWVPAVVLPSASHQVISEDPPVPSKKVKTKQVEVKVEKPKPTEKKGKSKWRDNNEEDEDAMAVDDNASDQGEPKQKWPCLIYGEKSDQKWTKFFLSIFFSDFKYMKQEKRITILEAQVSTCDKVAQESTQTSQRLDTMEGQVHRFTGALESFPGQIRIDDTFRLVPDKRQITPAPAAGPSHIRSASPSPLLEIPMDEDDADLGVPSSVADTWTTPSDVQEVAATTAAISDPIPDPVPDPITVLAPAPSVDSLHLPTVNLIPATPQGSSVSHQPPLPTAIAEAQAAPPPPCPVPHGHSRTPAVDPSRLGLREGPTTRARSCSKTPIWFGALQFFVFVSRGWWFLFYIKFICHAILRVTPCMGVNVIIYINVWSTIVYKK